jgi:hypothetical protein
MECHSLSSLIARQHLAEFPPESMTLVEPVRYWYMTGKRWHFSEEVHANELLAQFSQPMCDQHVRFPLHRDAELTQSGSVVFEETL